MGERNKEVVIKKRSTIRCLFVSACIVGTFVAALTLLKVGDSSQKTPSQAPAVVEEPKPSAVAEEQSSNGVWAIDKNAGGCLPILATTADAFLVAHVAGVANHRDIIRKMERVGQVELLTVPNGSIVMVTEVKRIDRFGDVAHLQGLHGVEAWVDLRCLTKEGVK